MYASCSVRIRARASDPSFIISLWEKYSESFLVALLRTSLLLLTVS